MAVLSLPGYLPVLGDPDNNIGTWLMYCDDCGCFVYKPEKKRHEQSCPAKPFDVEAMEEMDECFLRCTPQLQKPKEEK